MSGYDASEWKVGDVAMVTADEGGRPEVALRSFKAAPAGAVWWTASGFWRDHNIAAARRLVVIDYEDAEQVERLTDGLYGGHSGAVAGRVQAALREYALPAPRIVEPQGHGAVVEDANGGRWVRWHRGPRFWVGEHATNAARWSDIKPVRVLSEGVSGE